MKRQKKSQDWFKVKGYVHFTPKLKLSDKNWVYSKVIDEIFVSKYAFYPLIHRKIVQRRYKIPKDKEKRENSKATEKLREIFYATHFDSQIYSFYAKEVLGKIYENYLSDYPELSECICAYRTIKANEFRNKSNIDFANECFHAIREITYRYSNCVAIAYDVEKFFDSLNHKHLKVAWCNLLKVDYLPKDHYNIFKSLTNFSYVDEKDLLHEFGYEHFKDLKRKNVNSYCANPNEFRNRVSGNKNKNKRTLIKTPKFKDGIKKGIPQGTPISALLANVYLLDFDKKVYEKIVLEYKGIYRRYSDDIIVACPIEYEKEINELLLSEIGKYHLVINSDKTEYTKFNNNNGKLNCDRSLKYLGFEFDGERILIKTSGFSKFYRKAKLLIKIKAGKAKRLQKKRITNRTNIFRRPIYRGYTHLGKRNFISYARKASSMLESPQILNQIKRHWKIINSYISKYEDKYLLPRR
jgi:hypothetical protein